MPVVPEENKRTGAIRVRLSLELLERLEALAKRYGMPVSTLCAFAIARFVQGEEMNRAVIFDTVRQQVEALDDERMQRMFRPMLEVMVTAAQSGQLDGLLDQPREEDENSKM